MENNEYIYYTLLYMVPYLKSLGTGSTFAELSKEVLSQVDIIIPDQYILQKFNSVVKAWCNKVKQCEKENEILTKIREYLLPMLISGQIKI